MTVVPRILALAGALLVLSVATSNAQEKVSPAPKDAPTATPTPLPGPAIGNPDLLPDDRLQLPERAPEPTGVYGWIAIVDPATGQKWLPLREETGRAGGYPSAIEVRFVPVLGGSPVTVSFRASEGIQMDLARNAWRYAIDFEHVTTMTGPPARGGTAGVRYNPALWRFAGVEMGPYNYNRPSGIRLWSVDFDQRSSPFSDLPDLSPGP
jgi:hypothetical protein